MQKKLEMNVKNMTEYKDTKLIELIGELDFSNGAEMSQEILALIKEGYINLIIDLNKLSYINSIGILNLLRCHMKVKNFNGTFKIVIPANDIRDMLEAMGINNVVQIYETKEDALNDFN